MRLRNDVLATTAGLAGGWVWETVKRLLLNYLRESDQLDFSRAAVDSAAVRAFGGGQKTGPNPTDRAKPGSKHHLITEGHGVPLNIRLTGANRHEVTQLLPLVDGIPPVAGKPGRPLRRPRRLYADRAYDSQPHREELRKRHIQPFLARRNTPPGSGLGIFRWVVERTVSWLHGFRRLRTRYDRRADIQEAFLTLANCLICFRILTG
jgi:transposase